MNMKIRKTPFKTYLQTLARKHKKSSLDHLNSIFWLYYIRLNIENRRLFVQEFKIKGRNDFYKTTELFYNTKTI